MEKLAIVSIFSYLRSILKKMKNAKKIIRIAAGWTFIVLGLLGLVLPFLQGILFLCIGAFLLAPDVPFFRWAVGKLRKRYPALVARAEAILGTTQAD